MKLINLKCSNCGANLTVNKDLKECTCNFCGATTLIDDEVIKVEHTIIDNQKEEYYKKIDGLLKLKYFKDAKKTCEKLVEDYPYEAKAWFYMIKTITKDFNDYYVDLGDIEEYYDNYIKLETNEEEKQKNEKKYKKFVDNVDKINLGQRPDEDNSESIMCPYCYKKIAYGEPVCESCGEKLYWPK